MSVERLGHVWPEWKVETLLGEGSFGKVYKAVRVEHSVTTYSAIKIISIPQSSAELSSLRSEGWGDAATKSYFQGIVGDFVNEIKLMYDMKGTSNIVNIEDYKVLEKPDILGWDIFIRMELLTSFNEHISDRKLNEAEVIRLGEDMLSALELCSRQEKPIIHRDIKPENIFVSPHGYYKLGDFGIAREMEKTVGGMSSKGTYNYMAPEVYIGREYDATVDIYSLGVVLYKLLNNNKLPFHDPNATQIMYQDRKNAIEKRLGGKPLPIPIDASESMSQVILKACTYTPADRFQTPEEFKHALEAVKDGAHIPAFIPIVENEQDLDGTVAVRRAPAASINESQNVTSGNPVKNVKFNKEDIVAKITQIIDVAIKTKSKAVAVVKGYIKKLIDSHVNSIVKKANHLADADKFDESRRTLNGGLKLYPNNSAINSALMSIQSRAPVLLYTLSCDSGSEIPYQLFGKDNKGNTRQNTTSLPGDADIDNIYHIDGKYKKIIGTLYMPFDKDENNPRTFELTGDNNLLFVASMNKGIDPVSFSVDLVNVNELRVRFFKQGEGMAYPQMSDVLLFHK